MDGKTVKVVKLRKGMNNYQKSLTSAYRAAMDNGYTDYALVAWHGKESRHMVYYKVTNSNVFAMPEMVKGMLMHQVTSLCEEE